MKKLIAVFLCAAFSLTVGCAKTDVKSAGESTATGEVVESQAAEKMPEAEPDC